MGNHNVYVPQSGSKEIFRPRCTRISANLTPFGYWSSSETLVGNFPLNSPSPSFAEIIPKLVNSPSLVITDTRRVEGGKKRALYQSRRTGKYDRIVDRIFSFSNFVLTNIRFISIDCSFDFFFSSVEDKISFWIENCYTNWISRAVLCLFKILFILFIYFLGGKIVSFGENDFDIEFFSGGREEWKAGEDNLGSRKWTRRRCGERQGRMSSSAVPVDDVVFTQLSIYSRSAFKLSERIRETAAATSYYSSTATS